MRALVLSGGGSKGHWQVGALRWLIQERRFDYEILAGVSVGALIAGWLAQFPSGREGQAVDGITSIFEGVSTKSVWRNWVPLRELHGIHRWSFKDTSPLQRLVRQKLKPALIRSSAKRLRVGAVRLSDGEYRVFDEMHPDIAGAVLASAAFPAFFEPVRLLDGELWVDGGVRDVTPIAAAIDAGATTLDVLITERSDAGWLDINPASNALDIAARALGIQSGEVARGDIKIAHLANQVIQMGGMLRTKRGRPMRYVRLNVLRPSRHLDGDQLDFDPGKGLQMRIQGYQDARLHWPWGVDDPGDPEAPMPGDYR